MFIFVRTNNIFDLTHSNFVQNLSDDQLLLRALMVCLGSCDAYPAMASITVRGPGVEATNLPENLPYPYMLPGSRSRMNHGSTFTPHVFLQMIAVHRIGDAM